MDIKNVLINNYMPYAKATIISRAIPAIDGLKPVNRRILYTMYKMGLQNTRSKSANIVGSTMRYHPHGDSAIYEAMARMTTGNESLNVPYIHSKGNFGKVYMRDTQIAAPRYTEAKLADICKELFNGIDEDAVPFIDNYDNTSKEPTVLPVKFPSVLVNTSSGIAVGRSSSIPPFGLKEVCNATIGILDGTIKTPEELADVLGAPDFPTGGYIHVDRKELVKLMETGVASFVVSGTVQTYRDKIVISEIPYNTTIEDIVDTIREAVKNGDLKKVSDVRDESDINGLSAVIEIKKGCNPSAVLKKINRLTKLRTSISFITRVIVERNGKLMCVDMGVYELLHEWIKFRMNTIKRIYSYRLARRKEQEHVLAAWEKIQNNLQEVARFIVNNDEPIVKKYLMDTFNMDDIQAEHIMETKVKEFTKDKLAKKLADLKAARMDIQIFTDIIENDSRKVEIMIDELKKIRDKYGIDRRTNITDPLPPETDNVDEEEQVEDMLVSVFVTKRGYIKRLVTLRDELNYTLHDDDEIRWKFTCSNKDDVLVFTYRGMCYKIPVHTIDASRGVPKDFIFNLVDKVDDAEVMYVAPAKGYTGSINVVYANGRGTKVRFYKVAGKRSRYKNLFEAGGPGTIWCTPEDKFFIITRGRKAAYIDLEIMNKLATRNAFKVARIPSGDSIFGIQPLAKVPNPQAVDLQKYSKGYCVNIKDTLW